MAAKNDIYAVVPEVEAVSIRAVAGEGDQCELIVRLKRGEFTLRLIGRRPIRVVDLRRRDKRKAPRITVPFLNGREEG